jgi:single-stranded-DNA-specific exonuclease
MLKVKTFKPSRVTFRTKFSNDLISRANELANQLNISPVVAKVLIGRGIDTAQQAKKFLSPTLRDDLPNPSGIKNIEEASELLIDAIKNKIQITVYSDFDVDGLSGAAQLVLYLHALGANVNHFVPNRFSDGYGLVSSAVQKLHRSGTKLLVTVDCGITNIKEIALAKRLGLKTIILDHHHANVLPPADVVVDPAQEGCTFGKYELSAAGLVWMLLIVLRSKACEFNPPNPKDFLDLAVLGTVCDMVPLRDINRVLAIRGIEALQKTNRPGLVALKEVSGIGVGKRLNSTHLGFALGPRINAAGRLDDARQVFELLTTSDTNRAKVIAEALNRLNKQRQSIEEDVRASCLKLLEKEQCLLDKHALAVYSDDFHVGVIGIAAQRLVDEYYKPAAIMAPGEEIVDGNIIPVIKGSIRSIPGFHVAEVLQVLSPLLLKHGGHSQAGGFALSYDNLESFQGAFVDEAQKRLTKDMLSKELVADIDVGFDLIDYELVKQLNTLAPFGIGNPSPLFVAHDVIIDSVSSLSGNHLKFRFSDGRNHLIGIGWHLSGHPFVKRGERVNIAFNPTINTYQGVSSVQLNVKELWASGE